jgi:hypothetical protein
MMRVPTFEDPAVTRFLTEYLREEERIKLDYLKAGTANNSVLLLSPSKKTYEVKVSDAGALTVTLVQG